MTVQTPETFNLDAPAPIVLLVTVPTPLVRRTNLTPEERAIAEAIAPPKANS